MFNFKKQSKKQLNLGHQGECGPTDFSICGILKLVDTIVGSFSNRCFKISGEGSFVQESKLISKRVAIIKMDLVLYSIFSTPVIFLSHFFHFIFISMTLVKATRYP